MTIVARSILAHQNQKKLDAKHSEFNQNSVPEELKKQTLTEQYIYDFGINKYYVIMFLFINTIYMIYVSYIKKEIMTMQRINFSDQRVVKMKLNYS